MAAGENEGWESRGCCAPWRRGTSRSTARRRRPRSARRRRGFSASRIEACSALVSWYSSTSTWSKRWPISAAIACLAHHLRPSRAAGRRNRAPAGSAWPRHRPRTGRRSSVLPHGAPGNESLSTSVESALRVDGARVDGEAGALGREALLASEKPSSWRTMFIRSAESSRSWIEEFGVEPDLLGMLAQQPRADAVEGAGPAQRIGDDAGVRRPSPAARCRSTRRCISPEARREKVISRMRRGSAPLTIRWATRCASVLVLPEPAPAITSSGPPIMLDGQPLLGVQLVEIERGYRARRSVRKVVRIRKHYSRFVRNSRWAGCARTAAWRGLSADGRAGILVSLADYRCDARGS